MDFKKKDREVTCKGAGMNLYMKGSSISMSLAESTNVQVYISQVFVGQRQQMDVFLENARKGFQQEDNSEKHSKRSQKKTYFFFVKSSCEHNVDHYDEEDKDGGLSHNSQSDPFYIK